ncbi:rRNA methyltransferase 3, mitochondrial-like [Antedon mediterranea]|uniref:rRNA methyltransferase 3, mitochondrial-like n=1 Tax=Antedon mediterranea TaxID=105859 RepID=UPI003AF618FA
MAAPMIKNAFIKVNNIVVIQHARLIHISNKVMRRGVIKSKLRKRPCQSKHTGSKLVSEDVTTSTSWPNDIDHQTNNKIGHHPFDYNNDFAEQQKKHSHRYIFEKVKADDKQLGKMMTLVKSKHERDRTGKVLLEGKRLLTDAILSGADIETIYFSRHEALDDIPVDSLNAKFAKVSQRDIDLWTDVATPQGILAVCKRPNMEQLSLLQEEPALPVTLICDNIREPGNLGALLRSAAAVNCESVIVTIGCVDIWQPKVLRAGCGAHFRMPIKTDINWNQLNSYLSPDITVHVADGNYTTRERTEFANEQPKKNTIMKKSAEGFGDIIASVLPIIAIEPYFSLDWTIPCALVIGGESHGLSLCAVELCEERDGSKVFIPMANGMNSLNSAHTASIMLYEARRQFMKLLGYQK